MKSKLSTLQATFLGCVALLMWSASATCIVFTENIPVFKALSVILLVSFLLSITSLTIAGKWHEVRSHPTMLWVTGNLGVTVCLVLYIFSFRKAPAVHADLLFFLWPIFMMLGSGLVSGNGFPLRYITATLLGFSGICVLLSGNDRFYDIKPQYYVGYLLAITAALTWCINVLAVKRYTLKIPQVNGIYAGIGCSVVAVLHTLLEKPCVIPWKELFILIAMGCTTHGAAYILWDIGIKHGNFRLLTLLSYSNSILSVLILWLFGFTNMNKQVGIATIFIGVAGLIGGIDWREFFESHTSKKALSS